MTQFSNRPHQPDEELAHVRPERPLGVTVMTVANVIIAGTVPLVILLLNTRGNLLNLGLPSLLLNVGLPVTIIVAAIGAWRGKDRYRVAQLVFLTVYVGLQLFNEFSLLALGMLSGEALVRAIGNVLRTGLWLLVNYWYFLRRSTIAYYRRPL